MYSEGKSRGLFGRCYNDLEASSWTISETMFDQVDGPDASKDQLLTERVRNGGYG